MALTASLELPPESEWKVEMPSRHHLHTFCTKVPQNYIVVNTPKHTYFAKLLFQKILHVPRTNNFENEEGSCTKDTPFKILLPTT